MITRQPTKEDLQTAWRVDPVAFHSVCMLDFAEHGLSAAQWSLLLHPTHAFWNEKSPIQDPSLWAWAIDNTSAATLNLMAHSSFAVPVNDDTLIRLLLRTAKTVNKNPLAFSTVAHAAKHPAAWQAEHNKISAPEILLAYNNAAYLPLLIEYPSVLQWKQPRTGNTLLHTAVLNESKSTIAWLRAHGASEDKNTDGISPEQMALDRRVPWNAIKPAILANRAKSIAPKTVGSTNQISLF